MQAAVLVFERMNEKIDGKESDSFVNAIIYRNFEGGMGECLNQGIC